MIQLSYPQLSISIVLLLLVAILSYSERMDLERSLLVGSIRCFLQLTLMGFLLRLLFVHPAWYWVITALIFMTGFAVHAAVARQKPYMPGSLRAAGVGIAAG